jgi:hypothetical protein
MLDQFLVNRDVSASRYPRHGSISAPEQALREGLGWALAEASMASRDAAINQVRAF